MNDQPIKPCPFCGGECVLIDLVKPDGLIACTSCGYQSIDTLDVDGVIAAHNLVSLAIQTENKLSACDDHSLVDLIRSLTEKATGNE